MWIAEGLDHKITSNVGYGEILNLGEGGTYGHKDIFFRKLFSFYISLLNIISFISFLCPYVHF